MFKSFENSQVSKNAAKLTAALAMSAGALTHAGVAYAVETPVTVNYGGCASQVAQTDPNLLKFVTPGTTGSAPLTIVRDTIHYSPNAPGAIGCNSPSVTR